MNHLFATLLLVLPVPSSPDVTPGRQVAYDVTVTPHQGDSGVTAGRLITSQLAAGDREIELFWFLAESSGAQLPWPHRLGRWSFDRVTGQVAPSAARIQVRHEGQYYDVNLPVPLLRLPDEATIGGRWVGGKRSFEIVDREEKAGVECWRIATEDARGAPATIWVELDSERVVALSQTVIIGRGVPLQLKYEQAEDRVVEGNAIGQLAEQIDLLLAAVDDQGLDERQRAWSLGEDDQEILLDRLESIELIDGEMAVKAACQEGIKQVEGISRRADSVELLRRALVGKDLPAFDLPGLDGDRLASESFAGQTLVIHVWKYRHEQLSPPYGQIGFLDFLARRQRDSGVVVLGVTQVVPAAVNERDHRAQVESARKLREFMNLSYPIAIDDGAFLKAVGDPSRAKESLPLWLVVRPDGTVLEYQVGLQAIEGNQGLEIVNRWIDAAREND